MLFTTKMTLCLLLRAVSTVNLLSDMMGLTNVKRLGLAPVLYLVPLIILECFKETRNQLRGFTFVFNFKMIVFEFYNSTCPWEMIF